MLAPTSFRAAIAKRALTQLQSQRRHGGSLTKNKYIETWNNWRGDSERRFEFNGQFFTSLAACGIFPFTLYYVLGSNERVRARRSSHFHFPLIHMK
ncbi:hypothetical protein PsorP6_005653 [Peronosclerospora sorghi]|uniref:Uncharacterized protein n=1 Tax=Peronosclerospora sorghi TaxID=230839 RepID=A0ACC0W4T9_9STRA|nr:hypothetical protein PsorP6_005653 [Peronosclerospora sorghi]